MRITIETDAGDKVIQTSDAPNAAEATDAGAAGQTRIMAGAASAPASADAIDAGSPPADLIEQVERARLMETKQAGTSTAAALSSAEDAGAGPRIIQ
jgi:hypothetical protein